MCAKLIKEGKGLITVAKYLFMGWMGYWVAQAFMRNLSRITC